MTLRNFRLIQILGAIVLIGGLSACAEVPKESIELSMTMGRDLAEVHRANRELATRYFARMKTDVGTFVNETYRPYAIKEALIRSKLLDRVKPAAMPGASNEAAKDALDELEIFVDVVSEDIENYRLQLLKPIASQEATVLKAIDDAHQNLQNANSIVTGHLMSVRKVQDAQAEFLNRAGIGEYREKFVNATVSLSDTVANLLEKGRKGQEKLDDIAPKIQDAVDKIKQVTK